jgi:DNA polymerase III epsilon subunit-like protein
MLNDTSAPACSVRFVALDFEGTGTVASLPDEPWQIGLVQLIDGCISPNTCFESLLKVGERPFSPHAPGRHGELRREIAAAPTLPDLWPQLAPVLTNAIPVAHNSPTERRYLTTAFPLHAPKQFVDTLKLVRKVYPSLPSSALDDVLDSLNLRTRTQALAPGRNPHDALYDAIGCGVLLEHLLALPGWEKIRVEQLLAIR